MTAMAEVWGRMALRLANAEAYPFDFVLYASRVSGFIDTLSKTPGAERVRLQPARVAARRWRNAGLALDSTTRSVLARPDGAPRTRALLAMNEALRGVEQQLLLPEGIPNRPGSGTCCTHRGRPTRAMTLPGILEALRRRTRRAPPSVAALTARLNAAAAMVGAAAAGRFR
jgi:hypothetical protein